MMKRCTQNQIIHHSTISIFRNLKSLLSLSPRHFFSTLSPVQYSDSEQNKDSDKCSGVIQDNDLLKKTRNGNLLVLDLIDRGAMESDARLYIELLKKCTDQGKLKEGQMVHAHFLTSRFQHYVVLQNTTINMYSKCGDMETARKAFDEMPERDIVSYTMLITGYSQSNEFKEALGLYVDMVEKGLQPNEFTFGSALKSASGMQSDGTGRAIHGACVKFGYEDNVYVGSALVDMYTRCERMSEAKIIFHGMKRKNEVSWNALIAAYAREGEAHNAVNLFSEMKRGGFNPTHFTFSSIFAACASNGALEQGKWVHADMVKSGLKLVAFVGNTLLDMYGKAGSINDAKKVFYRLVKKDVVSWNSMLTAYAQHGLGPEAVDLFEEMRGIGFQPNEITFLCVLNACSHSGLLDKGMYYFELMRKYNLEPDIMHYVTVVDLLGRAGQLDRAERFVREMVIPPTAVVWKALLGACRMHKNMELGVYAAERVFELDPLDSGPHMLLSNIYASAGRLSDAARVRKMMNESGVKKEPACSWVEIENVVHTFVANDDNHPQREEISEMWEKISNEIKKIGYVPDTSHVLWFVDQQEREERLQYHSEKLALAFAVLNTSPDSPIMIKKNIRVCGTIGSGRVSVMHFVDTKITWSLGPVLNFDQSSVGKDQLTELVAAVSDVTGKEDLLEHLHMLSLQKIAFENGNTKIVLGTCMSRIACHVLEATVKGQGFSLAADIQYVDARWETLVVLPLRDCLSEELNTLCSLDSLKTIEVLQQPRSGINGLISSFVQLLQDIAMGKTGEQSTFLLFPVYFLAMSAYAADIKHLNIGPMPKSASYGYKTLYLNNNFELKTDGSKFNDASKILNDAFLRLIDVVKGTHVIEAGTSKTDPSLVLKGIHVVVLSPSDELQHGIDESYKLHIPEKGNPLYAHLEVSTNCLRGFTWATDTSRHYLPLPIIKKVIDSMVYAKLNVLHWHIVDSQSFPLEVPSYPKLWNGAYSVSERYTITDAIEIVSYAKRRGINVLAELDVPGHPLSWGIGYHALWPSTDCREPLDVSNEFTFKLIDGILSDFSKIFKYKFIHLGGDEVNTSCWESTPHVRKWEETFNDFGSKLSPKTVVHNWLGGGVAQSVVEAGLRCIVSNQDKWYLDHLDALWQDFYSNEPLTNITNPKQQALILGGEVCMWGEHVDGSDFEQTIWPRAAAAAGNRIHIVKSIVLAKDPEQVTDRLSYFRCLLNQWGVAAAPLEGLGRAASEEPGSLPTQTSHVPGQQPIPEVCGIEKQPHSMLEAARVCEVQSLVNAQHVLHTVTYIPKIVPGENIGVHAEKNPYMARNNHIVSTWAEYEMSEAVVVRTIQVNAILVDSTLTDDVIQEMLNGIFETLATHLMRCVEAEESYYERHGCKLIIDAKGALIHRDRPLYNEEISRREVLGLPRIKEAGIDFVDAELQWTVEF
ncbi:hypothetical protein BUALT_Bualt06G0007900 [Buddleja alternifolia]|uniref:beta-N-acetylhexosaminidase n=1 Tax=Buddleja alternifolia TaxID=168488 RepID=A0AAV6XMF7_9LAMI|nr:hypothetical protein BUALT_Bualt06G0007900 [Buddleja alternifolia]